MVSQCVGMREATGDKQNSALPANKSFFLFGKEQVVFHVDTQIGALLSWPNARTAPRKKLKKFATNDTHFVLYLMFTWNYCA